MKIMSLVEGGGKVRSVVLDTLTKRDVERSFNRTLIRRLA